MLDSPDGVGGGGQPGFVLIHGGRVALIRSEFGLVTAQVGAIMYDALGRVAPVVEISLAGHHMMLDQPLSLVTALRSLLAEWEHSAPFPRQHIVRR